MIAFLRSLLSNQRAHSKCVLLIEQGLRHRRRPWGDLAVPIAQVLFEGKELPILIRDSRPLEIVKLHMLCPIKLLGQP